MRCRSRLLAGVLALIAVGLGASPGCEKRVHEARSDAAKTSAANPASQPVAVDSGAALLASTRPTTTTQPQPPAPVLTMLTADGIPVELQFPPTKLLVHGDYAGDDIALGTIKAELFSDLPKSALRHYEGNELYLDMKLENGTWRFKSTSSGKADSPNGIFLDGQTTHLQPFDVQITLERREGQVFASVMGQFRAYQSGTPAALAPSVGINGELPVEIVRKR